MTKASTAQRQSVVATSPSIDVGSTTVDFDQSGFNFEGGIGYDFGNNWRTEVTYDSTQSDGYSVFNTSLTDATTVEHVLASAFYDFKKDGQKFSPFVGVSLGKTWVSNGGETADRFRLRCQPWCQLRHQ